MSKKRIVITHNDLDGVGCIVLSQFFQFASFYKILGYDNMELDNLSIGNSFEEVYVTDMATDRELYDKIQEKFPRATIYVFDHHQATSEIADKENVVFDTSQSGTKLFYDYLRVGKRVPVTLSKFVTLVDTYDMWKQDSNLWKKAVEVNTILSTKKKYYLKDCYSKYSDFTNRMLHMIKNFDDIIWNEGEKRTIKNAEEKLLQEATKAQMILQVRVDDRDIPFGVIKAGTKISLVCSKILADNKDIEYVVCVNTYQGINGKISVRSRGFDCTQFTVTGGHQKAAGGELSVEDVIKFFDGKIKSLTYG